MFAETKFFHKAGEGSGGGGGGGDSHNKGSFLTPAALREAYPTAHPGDFAIVESTDTVWVWDSDGSDWKDADTKGQVTSVNNQTGAVTLTASDVGAATAAQGAKADTAIQSVKTINNQSMVGTGNIEIDGLPSQTGHSGQILTTDGFVAGWVKPEIVQVSALPAASEDEVDNIYQYVGATDANYTNGYFYKCVSDGQTPATYSWTQTDVQPQAGGLPSQTGQSGKFLTTDGTDASWSDKPLVNKTTETGALTILGTAALAKNAINIGSNTTTNGQKSVAIGYNAQISGGSNNANAVAIGSDTVSQGNSALALGAGAKSYAVNVAIGCLAQASGSYSIALGPYAKTTVTKAVQINMGGDIVATNSDSNTMKVANTNGNFEIMSADGTIPTDRYTTTPSADGTYVPTLTISSGVATRTWAAPSGGGSTALSLTLAAANWSNNTITVTATGVTASNNVIVAPAPASQADYTAAGIICTAQGAGTLTFTCTSTPSSDLTVNVLII